VGAALAGRADLEGAARGVSRADRLDLDRIADRLRRLFPDPGEVRPARLLGVGFGSVVVEVGERVFRLARNPVAAEAQAREVRLLPELARWLATPVPDPRWHAGAREDFPFGVMGYPKLAGRPLSPELVAGSDSLAISADLAAFLAELHTFPTERAVALGAPGPAERRAAIEALADEELPLLRELLTADEHRTVSRWWDDFLTDPELRSYTPRLVHGDLWYENVLVDDAAREVVGVVDFESAAVEDPAQDFATLLYLGERFVERVVDAYVASGGRLGGGFSHRLRRHWELRELGAVRYALRFDRSELADALRKLRAGPVLGGARGRGRG
jgi:aminoglycoside 2''-phosphotransferase